MAKVVVGAEVKVDGLKEAEQTVGSFKKRLREATNNLVEMSEKFGASSKEALNAAQKVASLKDAIGDAKALADTFNPDKKFVALSGALQGVTAGFSAVQGSIGLLGDKSEDLEKILLKVQSAMALQQGISGVFGAIDSFKLLGAEIARTTVFQKANNAATIVAAGVQKLFGVAVDTTSKSFNVLKGAIVATGIGALVVAIGFAVEKLNIFGDAADDAAEKQSKLTEEIKKQKDALDEVIKSNQFYVDRQVQSIKNQERINDLQAMGGKNQDEINRLKKENIDIELRNIQVELQSKKGLLTTQEELALKSKEYQLEKQRERVDIEANTKAYEKQAEEAKKAAEKTKEAVKKQIELQQQLSDFFFKRNATNLEIELREIEKNYQKRLEIAKNNKDLLVEVEKARLLEINDAINKDFAEQSKKKEEQQAVEVTTRINGAMQVSAGLAAAAQTDTTNFIEKSKERTSFAQLEAEERIQFLNDIGNATGALADLIGKQTAAGKALGAAQALINTYVGVSEVLRAKSTLPEPFATISKIVNIATIVATGIKNVKALLSVKVPGASGGGGVSAPSVSAPIAPQAQTTRLDQNSINAVGNAAGRAFVLETDVSNNQERIRRLNRAARIN